MACPPLYRGGAVIAAVATHLLPSRTGGEAPGWRRARQGAPTSAPGAPKARNILLALVLTQLPWVVHWTSRWVRNRRRPTAGIYTTHTAGNQLRHSARQFYLAALQMRHSPKARPVPGAPATTYTEHHRSPTTHSPSQQHLKRKRDQFRQTHKRARLGSR